MISYPLSASARMAAIEQKVGDVAHMQWKVRGLEREVSRLRKRARNAESTVRSLSNSKLETDSLSSSSFQYHAISGEPVYVAPPAPALDESSSVPPPPPPPMTDGLFESVCYGFAICDVD
jgi:hypothetical protein